MSAIFEIIIGLFVIIGNICHYFLTIILPESAFNRRERILRYTNYKWNPELCILGLYDTHVLKYNFTVEILAPKDRLEAGLASRFKELPKYYAMVKANV